MKKIFLTCAVSLLAIGANANDLVVELNQKVQTLEEQNRELRGTVEDLNHKVKVLSDRFETFSSDVEMRLDSSAPAGGGEAMPATKTAMDEAYVPKNLGEQGEFGKSVGAPQPLTPDAKTAKPLTADSAPKKDSKSGNPKADYENARSLLEGGDYIGAGNKFAEFVHNYPKDALIPSATYWMGVSYMVRGQHENAATAFATVYKTYPKAQKAPDSLLKLSKSLAALGRKEDACTTLNQLAQEFPEKLRKEREGEMAKLTCLKS